MNKPLIYTAALTLLFFSNINLLDAQQLTRIKVRGIASADSENINKEIDPKFTSRIAQKNFEIPGRKTGNTVRISSVPNGLNIVKEATDQLIATEYKFTLLSGHKYMVNDCLGLKVSAGEFSLKFKNPVVTVEADYIKIKLDVDEIKLNAIKIRIKPRSPDASDPNPCHFSGKFDIKGEAKNLSVTIWITPSMYMQQPGGTTVYCFMGLSHAPKVDWVMNALNIIDFINSLDGAAKDMILDGLDFGVQNLIIDKFTELVRHVWLKYHDFCSTVFGYGFYYGYYYVNEPLVDAVNSEINSADSGKKDFSHWKVVPSLSKGLLGNLVFDYPDNARWSFSIFEEPGRKYIRVISDYNKVDEFKLNPGKYQIVLNNIPIDNVPIEAGKNTELKFGVLNVNSKTAWSIWDESGKKHFKSENSGMRMVFPVGKYMVKMGGSSVKVELKDGETVEL